MDLVEHKNKQNESRHPWELARLEVIYSLFQKHLTKTKLETILDVGCGDTYVVSQLRNRMPSTHFYAIDSAFSDSIIADFQQDGITLYQDISILEGKLQKADLILLMDVIEHIENEKDFLKDLVSKDYINEESLFLITVPAWQSLFSAHDVFLKHYRRYAPKHLISTLKSSGFEIIESGNFFTSLLAPRIMGLLKERIMGKKEAQGLAAWQGSEKQSKLLKEILLLDFKTTKNLQRLGIKLPGLSTYALCRKSVS